MRKVAVVSYFLHRKKDYILSIGCSFGILSSQNDKCHVRFFIHFHKMKEDCGFFFEGKEGR